MQQLKPLPSIYDPTFIASNQSDRADNVIPGTKSEQLEQVRKDIREFKAANQLEEVIILWTANTERYTKVEVGIHDTWANLEAAISSNHSEISPSTLFAVASILEGSAFINGSPQNTFIPGNLKRKITWFKMIYNLFVYAILYVLYVCAITMIPSSIPLSLLFLYISVSLYSLPNPGLIELASIKMSRLVATISRAAKLKWNPSSPIPSSPPG